MINKSMILAAALALAATSVVAQEVSVGVKGGITIPNITPGGKKTPLSEDYSSRQAWGAGAFTDLKFTEIFSLQIGLEYSGQGGKKNGIQALPYSQMSAPIKQGLKSGLITAASLPEETASAMAMGVSGLIPEYVYADFKTTVKFNYLMLPVQAKFGWNFSPTSPFRFYVSAGIFGAYLLDAERVSEGKSVLYADKKGTSIADQVSSSEGFSIVVPDAALQGAVKGILTQVGATENDFGRTQDLNDEIYRFNFGFIGAVGFSYAITPRHNVFIEGGGNYGLVKIQKNDANGQNRIGAGTIMAGYSYTL